MKIRHRLFLIIASVIILIVGGLLAFHFTKPKPSVPISQPAAWKLIPLSTGETTVSYTNADGSGVSVQEPIESTVTYSGARDGATNAAINFWDTPGFSDAKQFSLQIAVRKSDLDTCQQIPMYGSNTVVMGHRTIGGIDFVYSDWINTAAPAARQYSAVVGHICYQFSEFPQDDIQYETLLNSIAFFPVK